MQQRWAGISGYIPWQSVCGSTTPSVPKPHPSLEFQKLFPNKSLQPISLAPDMPGLVNAGSNISIQRLTELMLWHKHSPSSHNYFQSGLPVGDKKD